MTVGIEKARQRVTKKLSAWGASIISPAIDFASGTAIINFNYKGKPYSFKFKDKNGTDALSKLSWGICRLVDLDIRKILVFEKTGKDFLALNAPEGYNQQTEQPTENEKDFFVLGLTMQASNEEIKKTFKKLAGMYHPDRAILDRAIPDGAINQEDRQLYEKKMAELNTAFQNIKKARGFG